MPLIFQMALADYLVFVTMHRLIRPRKEDFKGMGSPKNLHIICIFFHLCFIVLLIFAIVPGHSMSADCSHDVAYPRIVYYLDGLMLFLYLLGWVCHFKGWFKHWSCTEDKVQIAEMDKKQRARNDIKLEFKKLFE